MTEETPEIVPAATAGADVPPDHLSVNPRSPFFDAEKLQRGVGIRFKDRVRTDIEEYSITEGWGPTGSERFFPGKGYINRGISGQTTAQMLVRFSQDVLALRPNVVVILAGTNDIAGNTGPATQAMIEDNLQAMLDLAKAHGVAVVLASVLPVSEYPWMPGITPAPKVRALNAALKRHADARGLVYLDYYAAMANRAGGLDAQLATDGVHPTAKGYALMAPLAEAAIKRAQANAPKR